MIHPPHLGFGEERMRDCRLASSIGRPFVLCLAGMGPDRVLYGSDAPPLTSLKPRTIKLIQYLDIPFGC